MKKITVLLGMVFLMFAIINANYVFAESPHREIIQRLDTIQQTLDYLEGYSGVPKTGQTTSYATGDDGDLEKGAAWPVPRFTENEDGTVTDNLTKLTWMEDANCEGRKSWSEALDFCNSLASGSCGLTDGSITGDWRLPSINEMLTLIHWGVYNPAVPDTMGTGQLSSGDPFINVESAGGRPHYWSSTTFIFPPTPTAFSVPLSSGGIDGSAKTDGLHAWCVKGGSYQ